MEETVRPGRQGTKADSVARCHQMTRNAAQAEADTAQWRAIAYPFLRAAFLIVPLRRSMNTLSHQLSMTVLMTPDMANFSGNVHGGHILKLLDQVAYACASRYAGRLSLIHI